MYRNRFCPPGFNTPTNKNDAMDDQVTSIAMTAGSTTANTMTDAAAMKSAGGDSGIPTING